MKVATKNLNGDVFFVADLENFSPRGPHNRLTIQPFPFEFTGEAAAEAIIWLRKNHLEECMDYAFSCFGLEN